MEGEFVGLPLPCTDNRAAREALLIRAVEFFSTLRL